LAYAIHIMFSDSRGRLPRNEGLQGADNRPGAARKGSPYRLGTYKFRRAQTRMERVIGSQIESVNGFQAHPKLCFRPPIFTVD